MIKNNTQIIRSGIFDDVNDAVFLALGAYKIYLKFSLSEREEVINEIRRKLLPEVRKIAEMTVSETKMGNVEDKIEKLNLALNKTPGVEDLITEVKTGDNGMTLYELSPYGVVCNILPCTNPCATLISNTISSIAAGNSVVNCPHPRAINVSKYLTELINVAIRDTCGIDNLVVTVNESSMQSTSEIMRHPDVAMIVSTGGSGILKQAMTCGKKVIGAGPGNPVSIVDETADIKKAARDIVYGASFDNNLMCISEKSVVAVSSIYDELIKEFIKNDVYYVNDTVEMLKLTNATLSSNMSINKRLEGKSANEILKYAGISTNKKFKLIVVESKLEHPFVQVEMLMPLIPVVKVDNFNEALDTALQIEQGYKHTATIHSGSIERLNIAAKVMQTSVFVKNGSSLVGIGVRGEGDTSFTIATATGEGTVTARHFARRRRCSLTNGFSIR